MKRNFYLQHSLMTMHDPRIEHLLEVEGLKGLGAYWVIIEKLALLPEPCAKLEYLRPFCKGKKISFVYLKKIIREYQLFTLDEDGFFSPEELNPVRKSEKKTAKNDAKTVDFEQKYNEKHQKTSRNYKKNKPKKSRNSLNISNISKLDNTIFKEYIFNITSSSKEKETAADDGDAGINFRRPQLSFLNATLQLPKCHTSTGQMPHLNRANATPRGAPSVALGKTRCGIWGAEVWHSEQTNRTKETISVPSPYLPRTKIVPSSVKSSPYRSEENTNLVRRKREFDQKPCIKREGAGTGKG